MLVKIVSFFDWFDGEMRVARTTGFGLANLP